MELEIIKHDIDWKKLIELAFDKKDWGKKYVLYKYDSVIINCSMNSFDFLKRKAIFNIVVNYYYNNVRYDHSGWINVKQIEYFIDNFSLEEFKNLLNKNEYLFQNFVLQMEGLVFLKYILACNEVGRF